MTKQVLLGVTARAELIHIINNNHQTKSVCLKNGFLLSFDTNYTTFLTKQTVWY